MTMNSIEEKTVGALTRRCQGLTTRETISRLMDWGVVNPARCRSLAIRDHVSDLVAGGERKTEAMRRAAARFACSFFLVRKCVYCDTDSVTPAKAKK